MCRVRVCLSIVLLFGVSERVPRGVARAADLIEIQARQTDTDQDDFVTWTAAPCRIRIKPGTTVASDLAVVLTNDPTQPVPAGRTVPLDGDLVFAATVAPGETATADSLTLTLPQDGSWVNFFIAGKPGRPSERLKDAVIQAHRDSATGEVVGSLGVMVRIRKWAATLTVFEREELLAAMAALESLGPV